MAADMVIGKSLEVLFPEDRKMALMGKIQGTLTGEQWEAAEIPICQTGGNIRTVLWNSATIFRPEWEISNVGDCARPGHYRAKTC